jgi:hypothetical protein
MLKGITTSILGFSLLALSIVAVPSAYAQTTAPETNTDIQEGTANNTTTTDNRSNLWWIVPLLAIPPLIILMRKGNEEESNRNDLDTNRTAEV